MEERGKEEGKSVGNIKQISGPSTDQKSISQKRGLGNVAFAVRRCDLPTPKKLKDGTPWIYLKLLSSCDC